MRGEGSSEGNILTETVRSTWSCGSIINGHLLPLVTKTAFSVDT